MVREGSPGSREGAEREVTSENEEKGDKGVESQLCPWEPALSEGETQCMHGETTPCLPTVLAGICEDETHHQLFHRGSFCLGLTPPT